jgi:tetratricopeptide (TPR) repeat protein
MFLLRLNLTAVVSVVLASFLFFPIQEVEDERKWTDETGGFAVTAKLLSADATSVTLKKSNGSTVTVPLEKLSAESQAYVLAYLSKQQSIVDNASPPAATDKGSQEKDSKSQLNETNSEEAGPYPLLGRMPPPALADYGSIKKAEPQLLYATKIVDAYQQLLKQKNLDDFSRTNAEKRILEIEPFVSRNAVLVNSTFQTVDEILANDQKAEQLIAESFAIGRKGDAEKWIKKLNEAAGANPTSPHANYLLGLGHAARLRNFESAARNFKEAIERADTFGPILNNAALKIRNFSPNRPKLRVFLLKEILWSQSTHDNPGRTEILRKPSSEPTLLDPS